MFLWILWVMDCDFLLFEIFSHATVDELRNYSLVSKLWCEASNIDSLWKSFCIRDKYINYKAHNMTWKEFYRVDLNQWKFCLHLCLPDEELESVSQSLVVWISFILFRWLAGIETRQENLHWRNLRLSLQQPMVVHEPPLWLLRMRKTRQCA